SSAPYKDYKIYKENGEEAKMDCLLGALPSTMYQKESFIVIATPKQGHKSSTARISTTVLKKDEIATPIGTIPVDVIQYETEEGRELIFFNEKYGAVANITYRNYQWLTEQKLIEKHSKRFLNGRGELLISIRIIDYFEEAARAIQLTEVEEKVSALFQATKETGITADNLSIGSNYFLSLWPLFSLRDYLIGEPAALSFFTHYQDELKNIGISDYPGITVKGSHGYFIKDEQDLLAPMANEMDKRIKTDVTNNKECAVLLAPTEELTITPVKDIKVPSHIYEVQWQDCSRKVEVKDKARWFLG
ncbi:hypothetical protein, partial [Motilimonas sp. KMU-193]|uniref:hypothetical protein n=1 Tax=Motilimonas sp. KMU-193 TaxID=3388668 RepID=UPI00396B097A